jgi:hypothetical protein
MGPQQWTAGLIAGRYKDRLSSREGLVQSSSSLFFSYLPCDLRAFHCRPQIRHIQMPYPEEAEGFQVDSPATYTTFHKRFVRSFIP